MTIFTQPFGKREFDELDKREKNAKTRFEELNLSQL